MFRIGVNLLLVGLFLLAGLPAATAFPEYEEVDFTWVSENPDGGPSGTQFELRCQLASGDPTSNETTPCRALEYALGNSDTHVFFRWTLASAEFGPLGQDAAITLYQGFTGSKRSDDPEPGESVFEWWGEWASDAEQPVTTEANVNGEPNEEWVDEIEWTVDDESGHVIAAVPHGLIDPWLKGGTAVGGFFNVTRDPKLVMEDLFGDFDADTIPRDSENTTFTFSPFLEFQPAPRTIYEDHSGFPLEVEVVFDEPSTRTPWVSNTYQFNWSMDHPGLTLDLETDVEEGSAKVTIIDPEDETLFDSEAAEVPDEPYLWVFTGDWTILVEVERFVGSVKLTLEEAELPEDEDGNPRNGGGTNQNGNNTSNQTDDAELDDQDTPAPAVVVLIALVAAIVSLRRRR